MDGHGTGLRGRLITYTPDGHRSELTGWKDATPVSTAMIKLRAGERALRLGTLAVVALAAALVTSPCAAGSARTR